MGKKRNEEFPSRGDPEFILQQIVENDELQLDTAVMYMQSSLHNLQVITGRMMRSTQAFREGLETRVGETPPDVPEFTNSVEKLWEGLAASMESTTRHMAVLESLIYARKHRTWVRALLRGESPYLPMDREDEEV